MACAHPDKFPAGYIIELDKTEWDGLKSKFSTSTKGGKVKMPSAFPEKGLQLGTEPLFISSRLNLKAPFIFYLTGNIFLDTFCVKGCVT